jgi:hypothetical protein
MELSRPQPGYTHTAHTQCDIYTCIRTQYRTHTRIGKERYSIRAGLMWGMFTSEGEGAPETFRDGSGITPGKNGDQHTGFKLCCVCVWACTHRYTLEGMNAVFVWETA